MELTIQVVSGAGERLALHVPTGAETTVLELKQLIEMQNSVRFPVAAQRLIFQGQILQDEKLLGEYNIASGMALHLTLAPGVAASIAAAAAAAPPGPSNVRAAFASLPPSTRAPTPATLMRQYLQQMQSEAGFDTAIQTLKKICENIVGHPTEEKYRKLRLGNAALKSRLFDRSRGLDCVRLLGFQDGVEEGHIVLVPSAEKWETMTTLKRVIDEFASMPPPSAMFGGTSTSNTTAPSAPGGLPSGFGAGGAGGADFANMAAQASAMLQNPMMAQAMANHPMVQQMAQANPMIAQALQNPALLQQMMQSMQQNPAMMQQISQMMQNPSAMQQMMGGGGGGLAGLGGMGFPSFPSAPSTQANPFAAPPAAPPAAASNPFAAFATPAPASSASSSSSASTAPSTAASLTSATTASTPAPPATAAAGVAPASEEIFDEDEVAAAIARSLEEH